MGNTIKWSLPDSESTYDYTEIYRSETKTGVYVLIATQDISDNTYFDIDGNNFDYYKIRFKDESESKYSEYSEPIQGGKFVGYCNVDDVRSFSTKMNSSTISDTEIFDLIKFATAQINQDILTEYRDELVTYISSDKKNRIDGVNKNFYIRFPYLGDYNDDGLIDSDDIFVYSINSFGDRTEYEIDSIIDTRFGEFSLTTAPASGERLFITYRSSPVLLSPSVNMNVRNAAINYVLGLAHMRLDPNQMRSFKVNKISVTGDSSPSKAYMQNYTNYISKISRSPLKMIKSDDVV